MTKSYNVEQQDELKVKGIFLCRVQLSVVGFFGCICLYLMRVNMSVAIVCMTYDVEENVTVSENSSTRNVHRFSQDEECPHSLDENETIETGEFDWDRELRGYVNSAFSIGYLMTQILGGWLASEYSGKWTLATGMLVSILCTFLSPPAARLSVWCLFSLRIVQGLGQGVYFPVFHSMWSSWAPPMERTMLITLVLSGNSFGTILSYLFSGMLCEDLGWPWVFYMYGIVSVVWFLFWLFTAYDSPDSHPWITEEERNYIATSIGPINKKTDTCSTTPWGKILLHFPLWAGVFCYFCVGWGNQTSLSSYTQYMEDVLQFDIKTNGFYNSLPHLCKFISTLAVARIVDTARRREVASTNIIRKITQTFGMIPPAIFLIILGYLDCYDWEWAIVMLCFSESFTACSRSGCITGFAEMAPRYSGIILGIAQTFNGIPGIVSPIVVGHVVTTGSQEEWRIIFYISAGWYCAGALVYAIFGDSTPQPWGTMDSELTLEVDDNKSCDMNELEDHGACNEGYKNQDDFIAGNEDKEVVQEDSYKTIPDSTYESYKKIEQ